MCLNSFAKSNDIFHSLQFGFCKGLDAFDALLTITYTVKKSLDTGCKVHMIALDFSAAFDCVNHEALIFKLSQMTNGGTLLDRKIKVLTGTKQRVAVSGRCIYYKNVIFVVPPGSGLGRMLYTLCTGDMWSGLENWLLAYKDDATLFAYVPSPLKRPFFVESLSRDLVIISGLCKL